MKKSAKKEGEKKEAVNEKKGKKEGKKVKEVEKVSKKNKLKSREINLLVENFVLLQKALSDLASSFKALEQRLERFLELVEKASQDSLKVERIEKEKISEIERKEVPSGLAEKIEELLEQNKVIAEGMTLLEKILRERLTK